VLPPHSREAERAVLGSMLRDNAVIDDVTNVIAPEDFYSDAHQRICRAVLTRHNNGQAADLVTLAEELRRRKEVEDIGGYPYLAELWDAAPTAANAEHYAQTVRDKSLRRGAIHACNAILREAHQPSGSATELLELAQREVFALAERAVGGDVVDAERLVGEMYDHIDACHVARGNASGLSTGFTDLDLKTGGLHASSLVLVAARPSVGKTALGGAIALRLALAGHPVFFASLEQGRVELTERMACSRAKVDSHALRQGLLDRDALRRLRVAGEEIRRSPLGIDDAGRQSVLRIAANARRLKRRKGLAALFIDYLQLIEPEDRKAQRYEQVGAISRRLKAMAKELAVPVVCMAQLNRASEDRTDKRPRLADLRESGSLEMDADVVVLMHRPDPDQCLIELDVAKNRNGPTGVVKLTFFPQRTRFENHADLPPSVDGSRWESP
jgi:replicative DNA helicase